MRDKAMRGLGVVGLAFALGVAGCGGDGAAVDDAATTGHSGADVADDASAPGGDSDDGDGGPSDDGGEAPNDDPFFAAPAACETPAELPVDPLVMTGTVVPDVPKQQNPNVQEIRHLTRIAFDASSDTIYTAGMPSLVVFEDTGADPIQLDFARGTVDALELLDDGWLALSSRGHANPNSDELTGQGLYIVDARDPANLKKGHYLALEDASGMAWRAPYLYVLTYAGALITYDVSAPPAVTEISRVDGLGNPWEMVVPESGSHGYVADNSRGVVVVDLADPAAPTLGASIWLDGGAQDLATDGDVLFVAIGAAGVEVVDITDPVTPVSLGSTPTGAPAISVSAAEGYLWYATQQSVAVMDAGDPTDLVNLGVEDTDSWAMDVVTTTGTTAYLADWINISVYELDPASPAADADPSRDELYLLGDEIELTMTIDNRGGADLVIEGLSARDPRVTVEIDTLVVAPGEAANVRISLEAPLADEDDPLDTTLCLATNDPDEAVMELPLANTSHESSVLVGEPAPDFNLPDLDGQYHQLSAQLGKPVVLVYFATW